jgi:hypothetical protein
LAIADLNGDGQFELLTSSDTLEATQDTLSVHSIAPQGKPVPRLQLPVNEGITALAVCPQGNQGIAPIVVGTRARLWIIR